MSSRYRAGDRVVESDFVTTLPGADGADGGAGAAIYIARGPAPAGALAGGVVLESPGVAVAHFERGPSARRVWVQPEPAVSAAELQWFVRGLVVPTALQQRGAFFVHAGSAIVDGALVALVGESGVGKSLLAAQVARAGHRFYGDDSLVLAVERPVRALLGSSPLRLTGESARLLGVEPERYPACTVSGKRLVSPDDVGVPHSDGTPVVGALYFVRRGADVGIGACSGADAVAGLLAAEFHPTPSSRDVDDEQRRFDAAATIAGSVPARRLEYPTCLDTIPRVVEALVRDFRELRQR